MKYVIGTFVDLERDGDQCTRYGNGNQKMKGSSHADEGEHVHGRQGLMPPERSFQVRNQTYSHSDEQSLGGAF